MPITRCATTCRITGDSHTHRCRRAAGHTARFHRCRSCRKVWPTKFRPVPPEVVAEFERALDRYFRRATFLIPGLGRLCFPDRIAHSHFQRTTPRRDR